MSSFKNIRRVLIANRGEIAVRIIKTCNKYQLTAVAIYSKEDLESLHVSLSDEAYLLSGVGASAYTNIPEIIELATKHNIDVVIPGYGFLSENSEFAAELAKNGILFAGPSSESVEQFGLKHLARDIAIKADVPVVPGTSLISDSQELVSECNKIGYPVILKATAGGGGMGLKVCYNESELVANFAEVTSRGTSLFSNAGVFVEKYIEKGRHIEVQMFGNGLGDVVTYGERECSIQRRHQKVIEECPSPFVSDLGSKHNLRERLSLAAKRLASTIKYKSAGTVEFLVDDTTGDFYFLEVNTRLQVEHGITEMVYGVDLVYFMLLQAEYESNSSGIPVEILKADLKYDENGVEIPNGHSIEVRVYAENPVRNFAPCPGVLHNVSLPEDGSYGEYQVRIDHWIETGSKVSPYFDPLLAKVMVWSPARTSDNMIRVLKDIKIQGPVNNVEYCVHILDSPEFRSGNTLTSFLSGFVFKPHLIEFESGGAYTTIQDLPGRRKVRFGVPIGGPVDPLALQIANVIVGNHLHCEALEINLKGPAIRFHAPAVVALAGGRFKVTLDDKDVPMYTELFIPAGSLLEIEEPLGSAAKCYLAIKDGFPGVANYLGSKGCLPSLQLGGHQGRIILPGDCLDISEREPVEVFKTGYQFPESLIPDYERATNVVRVIGGPHDTPDIVSEEGMEQLYSIPYSVNFNSNRGATRLDGPEMKFSRPSGGDGGGHPSNVLEYPYPTCGLSAVGSVMTLYGPDGATASGFVCIFAPAEADFWKFGQAAINSKIHFTPITYNDAIKLMKQRNEYLEEISKRPSSSSIKFDDELPEYEPLESKVGKFLYRRRLSETLPEVCFRQAGERMIVIDFGNLEFDLFKNGRQHVMETEIRKQLPGMFESIECCTGAMGVLFDPMEVDRADLLEKLIKLEASIPQIDKLKIPSRTFRLPVAFEHSALDHCLERYMHSQRSHATYLPKNTDYLMKANLIKDMEQFKSCIIGKPEMVVAITFLCANVLMATVDPRCRLSASKYNPTRTSTPSGTISTGSVLQSIYPQESPGGYMMWGMTLPNWYWDTFCRIHENPWPFKVFDQVVFYEVDEQELQRMNNLLLTKKLKIEPTEGVFDFVEYRNFLDSIDDELKDLKKRKLLAFEECNREEQADFELWQQEKAAAAASKSKSDDISNVPGAIKITSHMPSNVFKIKCKAGDVVAKEDPLVILEAMKMEIPVHIKDKSGFQKYEVLGVIVEEGDIVNPGDVLMIIKGVESAI
ncbi:hypothetical protein KL905_003096 [Ogataea polymorpha]|nr:hypothetical protein KL905_003096 [Ogataea polymorpha]